MVLDIRPVTPADRDQWAELFAGYREFYELIPDPAVVDRVWGWITDAAHEVGAIVAEDGGRLVGIAHYRRFSRPSAGTTGIYLDDLFTASDSRGRGVGGALIGWLAERAEAEGRSVVRWMTSESNATARALYDRVAIKTQWVTYEVKVG